MPQPPRDRGGVDFDPQHLRPLASLNRRAVIALPGVAPELVGRTAFELAAAPALVALLREHAAALGLEGAPDHELPARADALVGAGGAHALAAAALAERYGRRLGACIASLLLGAGGLTDPLDAWEAAYLAHWRGAVAEILLGGGIAGGAFGRLAAASAARQMAESGAGRVRLGVAAHAPFLPLLGVARSAPAREGTAVVADFGSTRAKVGLAVYGAGGALRRLRVFPPRQIAHVTQSGSAEALAETMVGAIADAVRAAGGPVAPDLLCSVAAYVEGGAPVRIDRGAYTGLHRVSADLPAWFAERIARGSGAAVRFTFLHDTDAAAVALAGRVGAAVIVLGTGLGAGFVPAAEPYRPLAPDFAVEPI